MPVRLLLVGVLALSPAALAPAADKTDAPAAPARTRQVTLSVPDMS